MLLNIEYLEWDSQFYSIKIGRIFLPSIIENNIIENVIQKAKVQSYTLVYIMHDEANNTPTIIDPNIKLVDTKIIFSRNLDTKLERAETNIKSYNSTVHSLDTLYTLALEAGAYSRFKLDSNFPINSFKEMYHQWVNNSVAKRNADIVLVHETNKSINGFVSIQLQNSIATIGLIAVDAGHRGKGIGTQLIHASVAYALQNKCSTLNVATQFMNKEAMQFYKKNGFQIQSSTNIYHLWL